MLRVVMGLAVLAFTVYAVVDCVQTEDERVRNLPKIAWALMILFFTPVGGIAWFLAGRPASAGPGLPKLPGGWTERPQGPRGPDDDPDFLRRL